MSITGNSNDQGHVSFSCDREKGFTLMELVVVMALLAIMTTIAVPSLRTSLYSDSLRATARRMVSLINQASLAARTSGRPYELVIDRHQAMVFFQPLDKEHEGSARRDRVRIPAGVRVTDLVSARPRSSTDQTLSLFFTAHGYVDRTLIHLQEKDRILTLALSPFLAVVRIYDGRLDPGDDRLRW